MFEWLGNVFKGLFRWLVERLIACFVWVVDAIGSVVQFILNKIQVISVALVAGFSGYAPTQTLQQLWTSILAGMTWLDGPIGWIAINWIDLPELFSRMTYFAEALVAAYTIRAVFSVARAVFDLL